MTFFDILRLALFDIHMPLKPKSSLQEFAEKDAVVVYHEKRLPEKPKVTVEGNANLLYTKEEIKKLNKDTE